MPYSFTLTATIPASAQEIYDAWLDSLAHSQMTGGAARMSREPGAEVSAWGGYISGRNLELVPGERIVQSWRTAQFADEHDDSIITVTLEEAPDGTLLTLVHSNVPDEQKSYEEGGWQSNYFEPMQVYFAERGKRAAKAAPRKPKTTRAAAAKSKAKPKAKARSKSKPKAKRAKPGKAGSVKGKAAKSKSRRRQR